MGFSYCLRKCLNGTHQKKDVDSVINLSHTFALAYLRMKAASKKIYYLQGDKLEDLAWDFIADLFERDLDNIFIILQNYFDSDDLSNCGEDELKIKLRRLVFTKVEDNIFKNAGENDPSLKKIIRNLKLAIKDTTCKYSVYYKNGFIVADRNQVNENLPLMPTEFLHRTLSAKLEGSMQIPEILILATDILEHQDIYQKRYSLVGLALIVREIFVQLHDAGSMQKVQPVADEVLMNGELEQFLENIVKSIRFKVGYKYVRQKKFCLERLEAYMSAAKSIVKQQFSNEFQGPSQFEILKMDMPEISYEEFREDHRQVLEYMVKLIRADVVNIYRNEWA